MSPKYERNCLACGQYFYTNYWNKKYCGAAVCEKVRLQRKSLRIEARRKGKRAAEKKEYYEKNREGILAHKKRRYREVLYPEREVKEGWSTSRPGYEEVAAFFHSIGYSLLSETYVNNSVPVMVRCPEGHLSYPNYHNYKDNGARCVYCISAQQQSKAEREIVAYFQDNFPQIRLEERAKLFPNNRKEVDLFFPDHNVAVEYCGLYWHSEQMLRQRSGVDKVRRYHRDKMEACLSLGIRLITVFEDEYLNRPEVVLSRITNALGVCKQKVYARQCSVVEVSPADANSFFSRTHLQGPSLSKVAWGLEYEGSLVQAVSLGLPSRPHARDKGCSLELKRFSALPFWLVVGGFSRLFKQAVSYGKRNGYLKIKSYCDLRYANLVSPVYEQAGFSLEGETKYTPHYVKGPRRFRNQSLRKTPEERLTGKTEWELRKEQGFDRVWDCGHRTYVYYLTSKEDS